MQLALKQAYMHVANFIEELFNLSPREWSFHSWLQSRNRLQEADRIITALM